MYTMARDMLWRYGYLDGLFKHLGHTEGIDVEYGDVKRIPFITKDTNNETRAFAETILRFGSFVDAHGDDTSGTVLDEILEMEEGDGEMGGV